jgi:SAM-dependent methyltransferase
MDSTQLHLRAYYEEEARRRLRKPLTGRRVELREAFVSLLRTERRRSVVDFGAGPGRDVEAFVEAGFDVVGLDLAHANGVLAAERDVTVVQGSVGAPPFRPRCFDAGWSMSTLMHFTDREVPGVLSAMATSLRVGAPLDVGLWGGDHGDVISEVGIAGHQRLFSLRPVAVNHQLMASCAVVERTSTWDLGDDEWQYQVFRLRVDR